MKSALVIMKALHRRGVPWIMQHPRSSVLLKPAEFHQLLTDSFHIISNVASVPRFATAPASWLATWALGTRRLFDVVVTTRGSFVSAEKNTSRRNRALVFGKRRKFEHEVVKVRTSRAHAKVCNNLPSHPRLHSSFLFFSFFFFLSPFIFLLLVFLLRQVLVEQEDSEETVVDAWDFNHLFRQVRHDERMTSVISQPQHHGRKSAPASREEESLVAVACLVALSASSLAFPFFCPRRSSTFLEERWNGRFCQSHRNRHTRAADMAGRQGSSQR